jgi:hypothetical protein
MPKPVHVVLPDVSDFNGTGRFPVQVVPTITSVDISRSPMLLNTNGNFEHGQPEGKEEVAIRVISAAIPHKEDIEDIIIKVPPDKTGKIKSHFNANVWQELSVFNLNSAAESALQLYPQPAVLIESNMKIVPGHISHRGRLENSLRDWTENKTVQDRHEAMYTNSVVLLLMNGRELRQSKPMYFSALKNELINHLGVGFMGIFCHILSPIGSMGITRVKNILFQLNRPRGS